MDTPGMPEAALATDGGSAQRRRRRRRLLAVLLLLLFLIVLELLVSVLRDPGQNQASITSVFTALAGDVGKNFTISGTVTAFPACKDRAVLAPGIDRCLVYSIHNPRSETITVTSISISEVGGTPTCPADQLDTTRSAFTGALTVPPGATIVAPGRPIAMLETAANQDGCRGATFTFSFTGTARIGTGSP
jgi:hypothetical protein